MNGVLFLCLVNNSFGYVFSVVNVSLEEKNINNYHYASRITKRS